jgi:tetratricopeptide (TPR) repeat protein
VAVLAALVVACAGPARSLPRLGPTVELAAELADAERRVRAKPGDARRLSERGWLRLLAGDRVRAEEDFAAAARSDASDARSLLGLALSAELALGDDETPLLALLDRARARTGDPFVDAAAELALAALSRAPSERSPGARDRLRAFVDAPGVSAPLRIEALRALAAFVDPSPDKHASQALAKRRGCIPRWAVATEGRTPHGEVLSATRPPQGVASRPVVSRGCAVDVRSPRSLPSRILLETWVKSARAQELQVELEVRDEDVWGKVWLGEALVVTRADARRFLPSRTVGRVRLEPGTHRLVMDLASTGSDVQVSVVLVDPKTGQAALGVTLLDSPEGSAPSSASALDLPAVPAMATAFAGTRWSSIIADYLTARRALEGGDLDGAEQALERIGVLAPRFTSALALSADVELAGSARQGRLGRDQARRRWKHLLQLDPGADAVRLRMAEWHLADDEPDAALSLLSEMSVHPAHGRLAVVGARALAEKGLVAQADARLAEEALPVCAVARARLEAIQLRGPLRDRQPAAERVVACDGDDPSLAEWALEAGEAQAALAEWERLLERAPSDAARWQRAASAYRAAGQVAKARASLERALDLDPEQLRSWTALADLDAAAGDSASARSTLERGLRLVPEARSLVAALVALGGRDPVERWRLDGREVISAFEAAERSAARPPYLTPAVLVLDRTVVFVFPDGTRWTLTHNIVKVLEKSGLDRFGEVGLREGAEVLLVRTLKADGRVREPEDLGKLGITAPDLAVGDYVEVETLTVDAPLPFADGFVGDRFFFSTFEAPLDRTELVVVAPPGLELGWDLRGDAPSPMITVGPEGESVTTFAARQRPALSEEPGAPPHTEYLASVAPFRKIDLAAWRAWSQEQAFRARRGDRALRRTAREVTAGAATPEARVHALLRFVRAHVTPPGHFADEPSLSLARKSGHRTLVFWALCEAAGVPATLWLARPRTSGEGAPARVFLPELSYPLLSVELGTRRVFLDPSLEGAPPHYLSPELRGASALLVPGLEVPLAAELPRLSPVHGDGATDQQRIELHVDLDQDGKAQVLLVQELVGSAGVAFRNYLADVPRNEVSRELEKQTLGVHFPGVTLTSLEITHLDAPEQPLTLRYRFEVPRFARKKSDGSLEIPASPLPLRVAERYVAVALRTTPLVLGPYEATHTVMHVRLPEGFVLAAGLPEDVSLSAPADVGEFRHGLREEPGGFRATIDSAFVPYARVAPALYPRFLRFASEIDAAEQRLVRVRAKSR